MRHSSRAVFDKPGEGVPVAPVVEPPVVPPVVPTPVVATPVEPVPAVVPATPAPATPKKDWKDDRIAKLTHDLNESRRAQAAVPAAPQAPGETDAQFQARVDEAANAKAGMMAAQAEWDRATGAVVDLGSKEFPDFNSRVGAITSSINVQDPAELAAYNDVIAGAMETGQAHKVIYALGADPGEFQRLMRLSPVKRAMELGSMASKLINDKPPSNLPAPIVPINSSGTHYEGIAPDDPKSGNKLPTKEWMRLRDAQARERGIQ